MKLSDLKAGQSAIIVHVEGSGQFRKRILEMGFVQGKEVTAIHNAPLQDPMQYRILGYDVSLRSEDARRIVVRPTDHKGHHALVEEAHDIVEEFDSSTLDKRRHPSQAYRPLRIALVGNPNCGKTSLFNQASGAHEHVGNYSGVTVERKIGYIHYEDYRIELIDLPGSYSLSPYSPEEVYIRNYLLGSERPDIVLNVIDTTNIERNLYLTIQIKEMGLPVVVALNMFDEFTARKEQLDYPKLARLIGVPMIPTVSRTGLGLKALFAEIIEVWEGIQHANPDIIDPERGRIRPLRVPYGHAIEEALERLSSKILANIPAMTPAWARYTAIKLLEGDQAIANDLVDSYAKGAFILSARDYELHQLASSSDHIDTEGQMTDARYGYIAGALRETYHPRHHRDRGLTDRIDHWTTHRIWGYPIFLGLMLLMFVTTFKVGDYPMGWIEDWVAWLGHKLGTLLADGPLRDLLVDGIINGVGGVIVFLPNILILYLFISLFEDSGYMARAAFIMDKLMHRMGLHGKSFIPLIMGFGCNVPAIMATRTIESHKSRLITMLVLPFMSCSARLPVYLLLSGALFPSHGGIVLFGLYLVGILIAIASARVLRGTYFRGEDVPFVMELPPYRMPTLRSVIRQMWRRAEQYLQKMGSTILLASVIVWFLGYFPRNSELEEQLEHNITLVEQNAGLTPKEREEQITELTYHHDQQHQEQSWIGRLGKATEPIIAPLGFDWKMGVSLLSGLMAKEVVVSTLGVIYTGNGDDSDEATQVLSERLVSERRSDGSPSFTPLVALGFMLFVLIYFPCVATIIAIGRESGNWLWGLFSIIYSCSLAWLVSWAIYQLGQLIIT